MLRLAYRDWFRFTASIDSRILHKIQLFKVNQMLLNKILRLCYYDLFRPTWRRKSTRLFFINEIFFKWTLFLAKAKVRRLRLILTISRYSGTELCIKQINKISFSLRPEKVDLPKRHEFTCPCKLAWKTFNSF